MLPPPSLFFGFLCLAICRDPHSSPLPVVFILLYLVVWPDWCFLCLISVSFLLLSLRVLYVLFVFSGNDKRDSSEENMVFLSQGIFARDYTMEANKSPWSE